MPKISVNGSASELIQFLADEHGKLVTTVQTLRNEMIAQSCLNVFLANALKKTDENAYASMMSMVSQQIEAYDRLVHDPRLPASYTDEERMAASDSFRVMKDYLINMKDMLDRSEAHPFEVIDGGKRD